MILFGSFGRKAGFFGKWQEPLGAQAQGRQSRHKGEEPCVLPAKQQHGGQTVAQEGKDRQKPFRAAVVQRPQGREQQEQQLRAGVPAQPAQGKKFQRRGQKIRHGLTDGVKLAGRFLSDVQIAGIGHSLVAAILPRYIPYQPGDLVEGLEGQPGIRRRRPGGHGKQARKNVNLMEL